MKRGICLLLVLLLLAVGGAGYAGAALNAQKDAVAVGVTDLYGDRAAAEGLSVKTRAQLDRRLHWDTAYAAGDPAAARTDFRYTPEQEVEDGEHSYDGVTLRLHVNFSSGTSGSFDLSEANRMDPTLESMILLFRDVAGRTDAGETHTETVALADYYETFPLSVAVALPGFRFDPFLSHVSGDDSHDPETEITAALRNYFQVPVPADFKLEISIQKDAGGGITDIGCHETEAYSVSFSSQSVYTDDTCYFVFNAVNEKDGQPLDMSRVPGGAGVYRLPYTAQEGLDTDRLELFYSLSPSTDVWELRISPQRDRLLLLTMADAGWQLTGLDAETGALRQRLKLLDLLPPAGPDDERRVYQFTLTGDLLVLYLSSGQFCLAERAADGRYQLQFACLVDLPDQSKLVATISSGDAAPVWDGERLALAKFDYTASQFDSYHALCGVTVAVLDASGVRYLGEYGNSLDATWNRAGPNCAAAGCAPLTLAWG